MKNGDLVINGVAVKNLDIEQFKTVQEINEWSMSIWEYLDKEQPNHGYKTITEVFGNEFVDKLFGKRAVFQKAEKIERNKHLTFKKKEYVAEHTFTVLHDGWESDNLAWIIEDKGKLKLIMTSHGGAYESNAAELESQITMYEEVLADTKKALQMLQTQKK